MPVLKMKQNGEWVDIAGGGAGSIDIDLEDVNVGNPNPINADTLGGKDESALSVARAADADTLGGKIEAKLSVANAAQLGNQFPSYYAKATKLTPRNLLDNSDFTNLVNQRGQASYIGSANAVKSYDRWYARRITISALADGLSVASNEYSGLRYLFQRLSGNFNGKTITVAAKGMPNGGYIKIFDTNLTTTLATGETTNVAKNDLAILTTTLTTGAENGICVLFNFPDDSNCVLKWAALYEGEYVVETLPEYQPKGYGAELAECQRYFIKYSADADLMLLTGGIAGNRLYGGLHLPTTMRTNPTISYSGVNVYPLATGESIAITDLVIQGADKNNNVLYLRALLEVSPDKQTGLLRIGADGYIELSADL